MRIRKKKLLDFYNKPRQSGIFYSMSKVPAFSQLFNKLGLLEDSDFHSMDFDYMFNHSGLKTVSVMLEQIIFGYVVDGNDEYAITPENKKVTWDYVLLQVDQDIIDTVIRTKFLDKWNNLADTLTYEFDPLNPFSMNVEEDTSGELSSNAKNSNTRDITGSGSGNGTNDITTNGSGTDNTDESIFGFNSTEPVGTNKNENSSSNSGTRNDTSSNSYSDTERSEYNSSEEYSRNNSSKRTTTRKGNIGNLSAQQLIEQQREMLRYQIFDTIYNDLDSVLTRSKYY